MDGRTAAWELTIIDGAPPGVTSLDSLAVGDVDGDGRQEIVTGGAGALLWYRPATGERGLIAAGTFGVGLALEDVDDDGRPEVVTAEETGGPPRITWYRPDGDLRQPWSQHVIDGACNGSAHDLLFADMDGDGVRELVANAAYCAQPGLFIYRRPEDPTTPWRKHVVDQGVFSEGLSVGDLDGDGRLDLVHGPYLYLQPAAGPYQGPWSRTVFAPSFREMCRTALVDITGDGRPDIVIAEAEYLDGRFSWFQNRLREDPPHSWLEHEVGGVWYYAHSLQAWPDPQTGEPNVLIAEMAAGGWEAPRNWDARVLHLSSADHGRTWRHDPVSQGQGTHQAIAHDIDGDGAWEVVGKQWQVPAVQIWDRPPRPSLPVRFHHDLLDRDKGYTATDILAADVDGDGHQDVLCGGWWYRNSDGQRFDIPGIHQVVNAYDLDGDGRHEIIATKQRAGASSGYDGLTAELVWLKPVDPAQGKWEEHAIGTGQGDWPHGTLVAPLLPGGKLALVAGYHNAADGARPQLFAVPDDPKASPWPARTLADIAYGEEFVAADLTGDGSLDIIAGPYWLENTGDGRFQPHQITDLVPDVARVRVADVNGDGRLEVVLVQELLDFTARVAGFGAVAWCEQPGDPRGPWPVHVIDRVRSPHSLDVADLDGDGALEVIVGEHDPFYPYRTRSRLLVDKKADPQATAWKRFVVDARFEHHDGTKVITLAPGRLGIMSHGWTDSRYVHLWEAQQVSFETHLTDRGAGIAVRRPAQSHRPEKLESLGTYDPTKPAFWQLTLIFSDLRGLDLHDRLPDLMHSTFGTRTLWPASLPAGFDPARLMEIGKNPGLGLRALHAKGITGRGVSVAVIDQPIIVDHVEYADRLRLYEEIHVLPYTADLHGPATASIAVGKTVGVAPEANLYFIAYRPWTGLPEESENMALTFIPVAQAIERVLEVNRSLPKEHRIRVISLSIGWNRSQEGYAEVMKAVQHATDQGVFVLSSSLAETHGLQYHGLGRDPLKDPDDPASYSLITAWGPDLSKATLLIPMDSRTTAASTGDEDYIFYRHGGWSWVTPYLAGLYALACQVRPDVTPDLFWKTALDTGSVPDPASQPPVSREALEKQAAAQVDRLLANAKTPEATKIARQQLTDTYQQIMGKPAPEVSDDKLREWAIGWIADHMVKTRSSTGEGRIVNPVKLIEALQARAK